MKRTDVLCPGCAMPRDKADAKTTVCGFCGYNPNINAKERRALKRQAQRRGEKS